MVPSGYLDQPYIEPEYQFFYDAFWELGSERINGMSAGQIPANSITRFAGEHEMTVDERDFLKHVLRTLDNIFLNYKATKTALTDNIVDSARIDDHVGVSAILKRLGKKPAVEK